ncbi:MAG TPA: 5-methylcytosine-specific restriction endonuclease system specificity protein McrC [Oscillospiraceae bacterium]|nr:5-methylcytosine-specific restriction endonuclease system specificity protein McrC [Oscillospiraceae bacterium]
MTDDKGIFIQNIYCMLAYAYQVLRQTNYEKIKGEEFENIYDLFSAILSKGVAQLLKQGLYRTYQSKSESLPVMRGKVNIPGTIRNKLRHRMELFCEYDELSEDNDFNRVIKTALLGLVRLHSVSKENKTALRKILPYFSSVAVIDPALIKWNTLYCHRNNQNYRMLIDICRFVLDGLLLSTDPGAHKMAQFSDEHMERLYERFILEYYRHHYNYLHPRAAQVQWNLDEGRLESLPIMQTDITLEHEPKTLIIDAKYYSHTMQTQFNKQTFHSGNLYQIFTYVKNQDKNKTGNVSGMLLYAKTQESVTLDCNFILSGNKFTVKTLDLNQPFSEIKSQLDMIITDTFGYVSKIIK